MKAKYYRKQIKDIVNNNNEESITLISKILEQSDQAKQELRKKGYGYIGLDLLNTIKLVPNYDHRAILRAQLNNELVRLIKDPRFITI